MTSNADAAPGSNRATSVREAELLAFALRCSAENPAAIGSQRQAVELLDRLGIEPRSPGLFFHTPEADLGDAFAVLSTAGPSSPDKVETMAEQLASAAGVRWEKVSEPTGDDPYDCDSREYWRVLARCALKVADVLR